MSATLRELLEDIADRGRPGELAGPAWRRAQRLRARRLLTTATGLVAVAALILTPFTIRLLSSSPPAMPPTMPGASSPAGQYINVVPSGVPNVALSAAPGGLPGGWLWGGGPDGHGGTLVFDRGSNSLRELPFDWAIPAPTGDLVYVTNPDDWAGVLNLRTNVITPLQLPSRVSGPWSVGMPQWSADGTRLLRTDGVHVDITDAVTGDSRRIDLEGGCGICAAVVWLPGEQEVATPVSGVPTDGLQVYSVRTGAKLRRVPWYQARSHGFSPDGRYVVANVDGRPAIINVVTGERITTLGAGDTRAAYWAGPSIVLVVEQGGAVAYSLQGMRIARYAWPSRFSGAALATFTLIRRQ